MRIPTIALSSLAALASFASPAQLIAAPITDPSIINWLQNITNQTGHSTVPSINAVVSQIPADVQQVRYTDTNVYINATGIPTYNIGPWGNDPNLPANQHRLIDIPRNPTVQTGPKTATGLGPIGVLLNGVAIYNPKDANSYNNQNVWHSNAVVVEGADMDSALGHADQSGSYHHHQQPVSLMADLGNSSSHFSPLLGYAFDGFPIYGDFASANTDGSGAITRMTSSYTLRNITQRTSLPNGTQLQPNQYGPAVSTQYPLGYFVEDYQFTPGAGSLDQFNGRFTVTPDYPQGTYAYFVATDANGNSAFPYILGPQYNGVVSTDDIQGGAVTVPANAAVFAVPEPAGLAVLLCAGIAVFTRHRPSGKLSL